MVRSKKAKPEAVQEVEEKPVYHLYQVTTGDVYIGSMVNDETDFVTIIDTNGETVSISKRHVVVIIQNVDPNDLKRSINAD